jgi:ferredoxin
MRVEFDRRGCLDPDACAGRLACVEAWDRFERGDGVGRAVLRGIDGATGPTVGLTVPEAEEADAREAARACPTGAITVDAAERYDPWGGERDR